MSAASEIAIIESRITEIKGKMVQARSIRMTAERAIPKLEEIIALAKASNVFHANNIRHMKNVADTVDLNEFAKVREHEGNAAASLEMAINDLNTKQGVIDGIAVVMASAEAEMVTLVRRLEAFGKIVQFPKVPA